MITALIKKIRFFGISETDDSDEARHVGFTNVLTMLCGIAILSYAPYLSLYLPDSAISLTAVLTQFALYCAALAFSRFRLFFASRIVLSANALIMTVIESALCDFRCDIHFFLFIGVIFAFFVFPEKERKYRYLVASCFAAAFIAVEARIALGGPLAEPQAYLLRMKPVIRSALLVLLSISAWYAYVTVRSFQRNLGAENARMETELALARAIQRKMIPSGAPVDTIHSLYRPTRRVGGDFLDFLDTGKGDGIGIFLGEVSGTGVPAAFITSMIKTALLQSGDVRDDPAALMARLNDILHARSGGYHVTAFYGVYDRRDRSLRYAIAGPDAPLVIGGSGIGELHGAGGPPLALFDSASLAAAGKACAGHEVTLERDSRLLLFTDGLTGAGSKGGDGRTFRDELHRSLGKHRRLPGGAFIQSVYDDLVDFHGGDEFEDDICVICLDAV